LSLSLFLSLSLSFSLSLFFAIVSSSSCRATSRLVRQEGVWVIGFTEGQVVEVHSLQSQASRHMNGRLGEVVEVLDGGYKVRLLPVTVSVSQVEEESMQPRSGHRSHQRGNGSNSNSAGSQHDGSMQTQHQQLYRLVNAASEPLPTPIEVQRRRGVLLEFYRRRDPSR
jgi:hypothetical protein